MAAKPTTDEGLNTVWAETGVSINPDSQTPGKVSQGWQEEQVPYEFLNWIQKYCTKFLSHINEEGIPRWDADTLYPEGAIAKGLDNVVYQSSQATTGHNPTGGGSPSQWYEYNPSTAVTSDTVSNESNVLGATVTAALNRLIENELPALQTSLNALTAASAQGDTTLTAELNITNNLVAAARADIDGLTSSHVANDSTATGANVSLALTGLNTTLTNLSTALASLQATDVANNSVATGATVSAALGSLHLFLVNLSGSNVINNYAPLGNTVTDALITLDEASTSQAQLISNLDTNIDDLFGVLPPAYGFSILNSDATRSASSATDVAFTVDLEANSGVIYRANIHMTGINNTGVRITLRYSHPTAEVEFTVAYNADATVGYTVKSVTGTSNSGGVVLDIPSSDISSPGRVNLQITGTMAPPHPGASSEKSFSLSLGPVGGAASWGSSVVVNARSFMQVFSTQIASGV